MYWRGVGKKSYLYGSVRDGDRVRKVYYGSGEAAVKAAHQAVEHTRRRMADRQRLSEVRTSWQAIQVQVADFRWYVRALLLAVQWQRGWYQHKREWRRRRVRQNEN
jgi:hypothetical protein